MSSDISFTHDALHLAMNFFEVDEHCGAVHARILIEYSGIRQRVSWSLESVWIEYTALSSFEGQLCDKGEVTLVDMSEYLILRFHCDQRGERLLINPPNERMSLDGEIAAIGLNLKGGAMRLFGETLRGFPKWW